MAAKSVMRSLRECEELVAGEGGERGLACEGWRAKGGREARAAMPVRARNADAGWGREALRAKG
ncbi:hypothetical protein Pen01_26880 [Phytomonospora endophytica]|nr:hypothetical protein Pen01_26880 [Phytomonospora endophytica]